MNFLLLLFYCYLLQNNQTAQRNTSITTITPVSSVTTTRIIDLDYARKKPETLTTDEITSKFEYIALETTDKCLVSGWAKPYIFSKHIVMEAPLSEPMLFNRKGEFLTYIGRRGHGPGEFAEPVNSVFVDAEAGRITLFFLQKVMHFDLNGKFIEEEKFDQRLLFNTAGLTQKTIRTNLIHTKWGGTNRHIAALIGLQDSCLIMIDAEKKQTFTKLKGKYKMNRITKTFPQTKSYGTLYLYHSCFTHPDYFDYYDGIADFYRIYYNGYAEHPFHILNSARNQSGDPATMTFFLEANEYLFLTTSSVQTSLLSKTIMPRYIYLPEKDKTINITSEKLNPGTENGIAFWPSYKIPNERAVFEKVEAIEFKRRAEASNDEEAKTLSRKINDDDNPVIVIARLK